MKPQINIAFANGRLGQVQPLTTGCFGIIASAAAVGATFALNTAYQLKSTRDAEKLGVIDNVDNAKLSKAIKEFYAEAGDGAELWIMGRAKTEVVSDWFTEAGGAIPAKTFLNASNGKIRGLFTVYDPSTPPNLSAVEIDPDVMIAANKANQLFEDYAANEYAPFFTVLEGWGFKGDKVALPAVSEQYPSVGVLIGNSVKQTGSPANMGAAMGVLAGRLAKYSPKVNPGKVRNGALKPVKMYIKDTPAEEFDTEALYDKGYITFRTHPGRTGYYVLDVPMCTNASDDYFYLTNRRIINEAFRLVYDALLDFLLDEVPANPDGTIQALYAKTMESAVVRKVATSMPDELSADAEDPKDVGVQCFVDPSQNIIATSKIEVSTAIRPFGYNRWINVTIGFDIDN